MRLLNTTSFILEEFTSREIPQYAILSHRWGNQEISFQDIQMFKNFTDYFKTRKSTKSEGWSKIKGACEQAVLAGYKWIWVDSCCIDKTSSAELSEAINSMFLWYRDAVVCYAYLPDVFKCWGEEFDLRVNYEFRNSKWFGRGWTLQELLAPKKIIFFNRYWLRLGDRKALWAMVSQTTGIKDEVSWASASVAQKMSWASKRETTRVEDRAYSLMGLFGVNMPPLYGEGENAFIRLQLEILRMSDDESIFAWRDPKNLSGGLLARSPNAFQESGDVERFDSDHYEKPPYSMTNKGLSMEFPLLPAWRFQNSALDADDTFLAPLQCRFGGDHSRLALLLRCIKGSQFRRISSGELVSMAGWDLHTLGRVEQDTDIRRTVQVKQEDESYLSQRGMWLNKFSVASNILSLKGFNLTDRFSSSKSIWDQGTQALKAHVEEFYLINQVYDEMGATVAMEFTKTADYDDGEGWIMGNKDRFVVVFNVYATRARLGIKIPEDHEAIQDFTERWLEPGDWMTINHHHFTPKSLASGVQISANLVRNQDELGLRSYEAEILFQEPIELPNSEILPYQILPRRAELPNNEVPSIAPLANAVSARGVLVSPDPEHNYYIRSFLEHKSLEDEEHYQAMLIDLVDAGMPLYQILPRLPELANNQVSATASRFDLSAARPTENSPTPEHNYHIRSFLLHKSLEQEKMHMMHDLREVDEEENDREGNAQEENDQEMSDQEKSDLENNNQEEDHKEELQQKEGSDNGTEGLGRDLDDQDLRVSPLDELMFMKF